MSVVITVAPTGPIASKADNPALPTQPQEIAEAVHQAYLAGASVAHIHLRDARDRPTADLDIARRTMDLIAERCPILIQLSTGVDSQCRSRSVRPSSSSGPGWPP
jgi:uncharacterized protein (DUF849 family)